MPAERSAQRVEHLARPRLLRRVAAPHHFVEQFLSAFAVADFLIGRRQIELGGHLLLLAGHRFVGRGLGFKYRRLCSAAPEIERNASQIERRWRRLIARRRGRFDGFGQVEIEIEVVGHGWARDGFGRGFERRRAVPAPSG